MNAEEIDICRNLPESVARCMKSNRILRILENLYRKGIIKFDPFGDTSLTEHGISELKAVPWLPK